jgi:ribonuclease P protein component
VALPKANRLKQSRDFSRVYRHGKKAVSTHLVLRVAFVDVLPQAPLAGSLEAQEQVLAPVKVGIAVSQKVSKRAVVRNRIKRQLKAAIRYLMPRLQQGVWIVINVRPGAAQCEYRGFLRELEELLTKLEVINGHS